MNYKDIVPAVIVAAPVTLLSATLWAGLFGFLGAWVQAGVWAACAVGLMLLASSAGEP